MKLLQFLLRFVYAPKPGEDEFFSGVLGVPNDTENIIDFSEIVATSATPLFKKKKESEVRSFPYQYQYTSSSCVSFGMAKVALILYYLKTGRIVKFSPGFWYKRRKNYPQEGMIIDDIENLASTGSLIYDLLPCEGFTEDQMNDLTIEQYHYDSADAFAIPTNWVKLPIDFDTVAASIEKTGKGVKLWFNIATGEFFRNKTPVYKGTKVVSRHEVVAVDAYTNEKGEQVIRIEDSADPQNFYQKDITRNFFNKRCILARYPVRFKFQADIHRPVYDGSIISLQKVLLYEGFFPSNVDFVESYGKLTRKGVVSFQEKYGIDTTGTVGPITKAKLLELYS